MITNRLTTIIRLQEIWRYKVAKICKIKHSLEHPENEINSYLDFISLYIHKKWENS